MHIQREASLKSYNTFGIDVNATAMAAFSNSDELSELLNSPEFKNLPKLVLGGGSNILFTKNFEGLVLKNNIPGISVLEDQDERILVKAGAGENWHALVTWCVHKGLGGIENLSLIPGNAGAAPIQNIGAYGVELKDSFHSLSAVAIDDGKEMIFTKDMCSFGYRDSIFKRAMKSKLVITSVTLSLQKMPQLQLTYGAIEQELRNMGVEKADVQSVSQAVCNIRRSKLPDPVVIGNAGSFFKNPEITSNEFESIKTSFPSIVSFPLTGGNVKLAAGWMIEQCGWKGKVIGNTGAHKNQALVLVNYGNATGDEIWNLAMQIQASVKEKFGVVIEPEVNVM